MWCLRGDARNRSIRCAVAGGVLLPRQVVQEHPHRLHAEVLGPAELLVDGLRVERVGLPHLELVDGRRRDVVAADQPRLLRVPLVRLCLGPAGVGAGASASVRTLPISRRPMSRALVIVLPFLFNGDTYSQALPGFRSPTQGASSRATVVTVCRIYLTSNVPGYAADGAVAHAHAELAGLDHPLHVTIVEAKLGWAERERHPARDAGRERHPLGIP